MREATAWILELGQGMRAALGSRDLVHLVAGPALFEIPQTPGHCRHLMVWEGTMVPVLDLAFWLTAKPMARDQFFVSVISYEERPGDAPHRGALLTPGIPSRISVRDEQACDLPPHPAGWRHIACSCFVHENEAIPVLDLPFLFSGRAGLGEHIRSVHRSSGATSGPASTEFAAAQVCHP